MSARVFGNAARVEVTGGELRLVGVNTDSRSGFALVDINGKAQAYQRGERLPDGRIITDIAADHLVLERDGKQESLPLLNRGPGR